MKKLIAFIIIVILCIMTYGPIKTHIMKKYFYPEKYNNYVVEYSEKFDMDPMFVRAIIKTESGFNPNAESNVGAMGLMQITASTGEFIAKNLGITNFTPSMLYNPQINIEFGCWYLEYLSKQFSNNEELVAAAYNAGGAKVASWLNNSAYSSDGVTLNSIPYTETANYVQKVQKYANTYKKLYS
ncbi:lytic transglycosylase domain-containing protein [Clostridium massiliamazoniense]|uniref:lytic transglycosylase domain-containing protein n=1 Tax=Clostridium massiliamazoniense TaxID=1347366 RepID=UPI0006D7C619|nr:lytic transglycosylase domain-containing protein [Clostridium massiliamazoniense]